MAHKKAHRHVGSDFESFLREDKRLGAATAIALKRLLAWKDNLRRKSRGCPSAV